MLYSESNIYDDLLIVFKMSSTNSSIRRAITGMPSVPEEEDCLDVDRAARSPAVELRPVTSGVFKSGETVAKSS